MPMCTLSQSLNWHAFTVHVHVHLRAHTHVLFSSLTVLCQSKKDGKNYVIKEVDMSRMPKVERDAAEQEARVRQTCTHVCIVVLCRCVSMCTCVE